MLTIEEINKLIKILGDNFLKKWYEEDGLYNEKGEKIK